ncbi:MAG TPA: Grx4 family monothiol glutaredoxin [Gammaproteobacteria bacterium]|nr:Grx4 family monothiol glutaredoxin [Gammaproteobacteria bacterium]
MSIQEKIKQQIESNPIIIYMKGTPNEPMCGFSARAANTLKACKVPFAAVNVLEDPEIRQGIKDFSNWPTIPQVYIKGQFVGGSDIVAEMFENGELQKLIG